MINFSNTAQTILTLLGIIGVIGIAFTYLRAKGNEEANRLNESNIKALEKALELQKTTNLQLQDQINLLIKENGKLEQQLTEQRNRLAEYTALIQNPNSIHESLIRIEKVASRAESFFTAFENQFPTNKAIKVEAELTNK